MNALPGKILVVDNTPEDVRDIIRAFREAGMGVVYRQSAPAAEELPSNIRVVILDLDLDGCGSVTPEDLDQAVLVLKRVESRTRFYLVALWSRYITETEDWVERVRDKYREGTGREFLAYFLKPFGKTLIKQRTLVRGIQNWIGENPQAGLVFQWEGTIEDSRDSAVSDVVSVGGIDVIVRTISQELGVEATPRELLNLLNKILVKHASVAARVKAFSSTVKATLSTAPAPLAPYEWYTRFHYLQAYFDVRETEPLWTGDILRRKTPTNRAGEFAIVITPSCDLAQKRPTGIKVAYGTQFGQIPRYAADDESAAEIVKLFGKTKDGKYKRYKDVTQSLAKGTDLPERFHVLYFLRTSPDAGDHFHLLFDFSRIDSLRCRRDGSGNFRVPRGWQRLCRLDSPYIDDLLQKYSTFSSRVGAPSIPEAIRKETVSRIRTTS
ncbi:hypothetical protein M1O12_03065 [Dehalococcoidia bacterium]|nr:hypothetical protein [Dehalococcoidia bacterium]